VHAGRTVQRGNADARIVGERRKLRVHARVPRLGERVLDERDVRLVGIGDAELGLRDHLDRKRREQRVNSRSLPALRDASTRRSITSLARGGALRRDQLANAALGQRDERLHFGAREWRAFGRALQLDEAAAGRHHDVHVGIADEILGVVEVEHRHAGDDAHRHRGHELAQRLAGDETARAAPRTASATATQAPVIDAQRVPPSACNTSQSISSVRSPSARDRSRAQAAADEPLDLLRASRLLALRRLAPHRVLVARGSIPYSAVSQPWPLPFRNGGTPSSTLTVHSTRVCPSRPAPSLRRAA
jgi:hypothetical protein